MKAIGYLIGLVLALLIISLMFGCTKENNTTQSTVTPTETILIKVNKIDAGEKLYIYYTSEDSTISNWTKTLSGHGNIRAKIHLPGTSNDITPTKDSIWIYVNGTLQAIGCQNNFLDVSCTY